MVRNGSLPVGWRYRILTCALYPRHIRTKNEPCTRVTERQPASTGRRSPRAFGLSGARQRFSRTEM